MENRGEGGHHDGAQSGSSRLYESLPYIHALSPVLVDCVHIKYTVIYDGAYEHQEAYELYHGDLDIHYPKQEEGSYESEGYGSHDHEGELG